MLLRTLPQSLILMLLICIQCEGAHGEPGSSAAVLCQLATASAELQSGVPNQLLGAISRVETGRYDAGSRTIRAWPWTINALGIGHFYDTKSDAVAAARIFQNAGIRSIDVGCMQINLMFHPDGFGSLEEAFDPHSNSVFAARFLTDLFHQTGSWPHAAAAYHSQTPDLGIDYQKKVLDAWAEPVDRPADGPQSGTARARRSMTVANSGGPPTSFASSPPPLGGFGHIIRSNVPAGPGLGTMGLPMGSLAGYRARPVAMSFLPMHGSRN